GGGRVERRVAPLHLVRAPDRHELLITQGQHPRRGAALLELDLEPAGDRGDQIGPAQARVARGHAASASGEVSSRRRLAAMLMWSGPTTSDPSRSATVRATRRMRVWPRAERVWRS